MNKLPPIDTLPLVVLREVFSFLEFSELDNAQTISKKILAALKENQIWRVVASHYKIKISKPEDLIDRIKVDLYALGKIFPGQVSPKEYPNPFQQFEQYRKLMSTHILEPDDETSRELLFRHIEDPKDFELVINHYIQALLDIGFKIDEQNIASYMDVITPIRSAELQAIIERVFPQKDKRVAFIKEVLPQRLRESLHLPLRTKITAPEDEQLSMEDFQKWLKQWYLGKEGSAYVQDQIAFASWCFKQGLQFDKELLPEIIDVAIAFCVYSPQYTNLVHLILSAHPQYVPTAENLEKAAAVPGLLPAFFERIQKVKQGDVKELIGQLSEGVQQKYLDFLQQK